MFKHLLSRPTIEPGSLAWQSHRYKKPAYRKCYNQAHRSTEVLLCDLVIPVKSKVMHHLPFQGVTAVVGRVCYLLLVSPLLQRLTFNENT